jgi:hypothetical protein
VSALLGFRIVPATMARDRCVEFKLERWTSKAKRRKNWRVVRVEIDRPGCYQVGNTLYMHPELIARLASPA